MKTRQELEKQFDEADLRYSEVKQYIFETIIPEVLDSIMPVEYEHQDKYNTGYNDSLKEIKQNIKECYNITL